MVQSTSERPFPRATYRFQLNGDFGFGDVARLAPYVARLGASHAYLSPIFAARPGSSHGYDGIDHNRLNPALGSEDDFRAMVEALRAEGLGIILDFVPNHMGIGGTSNEFWLSVLEWGAESPHADLFDIDWRSPYPGLAGKLLFPFLGKPCGEAIRDGDLKLAFDAEAGAFSVMAHETHRLPVCPRDYAAILGDGVALAQRFAKASDEPAGSPVWAELKAALAKAAANDPAAGEAVARINAAPEALAELVARQHWRAAKYSLDSDAINYRRFFTVSDLAGLRVEDPEVFENIHGLILSLVADGTIDGIRIDHIDGLADPKEYTLRLREAADRPFYLLVEKILAEDEKLPPDWDTDGTTGYEFANLLVGLFIDPEAAPALDRIYRDFTGQTTDPHDVVLAGKRAIIAGPMAAELDALTRRFHGIAIARPETGDLGYNSLRRALLEMIAAFDVYRTYATAGGMPERDRVRVERAVAAARRAVPGVDAGVFDLIAAVLTLDLADARPEDRDAIAAAAIRFQQLSGPVMAKGLEDAALYRYNRMIALNEVGSEPGSPPVAMAAFHKANSERLAREPRAMLTTSTHDTKRGEDARMRIAALTFHPQDWDAAVRRWRDLLAVGESGVDPNEEYFFYQLLIGAWPAEWREGSDIPGSELDELRARIIDGMMKSVREANVNTRWIQGDAPYEEAVTGMIERALDPGDDNAFLKDFRRFESGIAGDGAFLSLAQTVLRLTVPGVPDIYQGAELWDQSMVDPDNRRPVDYALRERFAAKDLAPPDPADPTGHTKLTAIRRLLALRKDHPALFAAGSYEPVEIEGQPRTVAFRRRSGDAELLVAIRLPPHDGAARLGAALPSGPGWQDVLAGGSFDPDTSGARNILVLFASEGAQGA